MSDTNIILEITPLFYKGGYKYQSTEDFSCLQNIIIPANDIVTKWITLTKEGKLFIKAGYAWDGPSGPTYDSKNSMRASKVHDALYQLMRMGHLSQDCRDEADLLLDQILKKDKMWAGRRWYWLKGVEWFASGAADPDNVKPVLTAP